MRKTENMRKPKRPISLALMVMVGAMTALASGGAVAAETPRRGGVLSFVVGAAGPPSYDGHRETTFATIHPIAPFYSVLIRVNPENPTAGADFVCDLCLGKVPKPTDGGKRYAFEIRKEASVLHEIFAFYFRPHVHLLAIKSARRGAG